MIPLKPDVEFQQLTEAGADPGRKKGEKKSTQLEIWDIFPMTRRIMLTHKTTDMQTGGIKSPRSV